MKIARQTATNVAVLRASPLEPLVSHTRQAAIGTNAAVKIFAANDAARNPEASDPRRARYPATASETSAAGQGS